ncbi:hypothetical protein G9464_05695 [Halostella sp. JP-L12]|uniref:DUF7344 domain-containing protein n=1 Tax=Halostella TaxID=1843185 RepID=UPI0013CF17B1|nr:MULTISPECIES: hypothetical protein [Halostella]NHN47091.1 hypothetical protein [Halostella sp. JP-L12]
MTKPSEMEPTEFDTGGNRQDELFDVLSHQRRRFLLHALQTAETPVQIEELTTELVVWETQQPVPNRSGDDRTAIEVSLVHNHLPKMAQAGLIRYDETEQTVMLADRTDEVKAHLQTMASD